jgi:hypothetical protein
MIRCPLRWGNLTLPLTGRSATAQVGGRVVLAGKLHPPLACQLLQQRSITYLVGSPTMLQTIVSAAAAMRLPRGLVRSPLPSTACVRALQACEHALGPGAS